MTESFVESAEAMIELGKRLARSLHAGDLVVFDGDLGTGKTTLIRGILEGLGWTEAVRSPTFNLFSIYETEPPVLHADFYRLTSARGTGIEDYLDTHLCLVEWPKALLEGMDLAAEKRVKIEFAVGGRRVQLSNIEG